MRAIIPVAGLGSRFKPITDNIQKCLLPVGGQPILGHIINRLNSINITELVLVVGCFADQVKEYIDTLDLDYKVLFVEQKERLGLGHAVLHALDYSNEEVIILLGDAIIDMDYKKFIENKNNMVAVDKVLDPKRYGIIDIRGNKISSFIEKPDNPPSDFALVGVYKINSQLELQQSINKLIKNNITTKNEYQLTDALRLMVESGLDFEYQNVEKNLDCGIPENIIMINKYFLEQAQLNYISPYANIDNSTINYCTIMDNCKIVNSELNNVIVLNDSNVNDKVITDAIIGYDKIFYK